MKYLLVGSLAQANDITKEYKGELMSKELFIVYCPHSDTSTRWKSGKTNSIGTNYQ